jgi:predicted DNA binding CopG/RHH family protein
MVASKKVTVVCYLEPAQVAALKKLSTATGAPVQFYIRKALDQFLRVKKPAKR